MLARGADMARRWRMRRVALILALCTLPALAHAQTPEETRAAVNKFLDVLKTAPNAEAASVLELQIQRLWLNESSPTVTLLMTRGLHELKADANSDAIEDFGDAITLDPTLAEAYLQRAIARYQAGDTDGAVNDIEATLKQDPRHFTAFATLSRIAEGRKDWKGAYAAWQQYMQFDPKAEGGEDRLRELKRKAFGEET
jgi:tetratricopeptide (TPR) repeat protein